MSQTEIRFDDGEAYERFMGKWRRAVGEVFLDWLAPALGLRWVDVGCGNGAFTELLLERADPAVAEGIDPSSGQLEFARTRLAGHPAARFQLGSAAHLPFEDATFDVAVMALVIFFVPDPAGGVAEMVRVTRPGGTVAAYAWDIPGGGFPTELLREELRAFGAEPPRPPRAEVSSAPALEALWRDAGLEHVTGRRIEVERTFETFDAWWESCRGATSQPAGLDRLTPHDTATLRARMRERVPTEADGRVTMRAWANAVAGSKPAG